MRKEWGLLERVLTGEKRIESRWYKFKTGAWDKVHIGDRIYFKNSGEPVTVRAEVEKVEQYSDLSPARVARLLASYGQADGIKKSDVNRYVEMFRYKKYVALIYLKDPKKIPPFEINKKGFGMMSAWLTLPNIKSILLPR